MRHLFLAVLGVIAYTGVASAQPPQYVPIQVQPAAGSAYHPAAPVGTPVTEANVRGAFRMEGGHKTCYQFGASCQNGCGSMKSTLAFQFGSCKNFFAPCGPSWTGGCGTKCGKTPFAAPFGTGWSCPRQYDSYANH